MASAAVAGCSTNEFVSENPVIRAMPPLKAGVYTLEQVDVKPVATHEIEPEFPIELGSILTGQALVVFTVRPDGKVDDTGIVSADDILFGEAALKAIAKWRFRPAQLKGSPVPCRMTGRFFFDSPYGYVRQEGAPPAPPGHAPPDESRSQSVILR